MSLAGFLRQRCTIETVTRTPDGQGGEVEAWAPKLENVPCRVQTIGADRRTTNSQDEVVYTHEVTLLGGVEIDRHNDRIVFEGQVLEIVAPIPAVDGGGKTHHQRVQCKEVR